MFDLFEGRRLILAGGRPGGFWVAAGGVALVLLLWLYREERRLVSRPAGLGLLALRLSAAAVLVLALFEPIAVRMSREVVKGRLIVAADVSASMATADPGRSAAERRRLAEVLRLSPRAAVETLPRREVLRRLVEHGDGPIARLAREHPVEVIAFARGAATTTLGALTDVLKRPTPPDDPDALATDWRPALAEALRDDEAPTLGVVLLTDGRQNGPDADANATVDRLAARGVPVFPVLVGSTRPPRDAAVAEVRAPESVDKGDVATVAATLKLDGYAGRDVAVTLERPGAPTFRQVVAAPPDGTRPVVTFRVPLDEPGDVPIAVAVDPQEGDSRPDNDRLTRSIRVVDDKARVLLVDGEARWEFRYLRDALARDRRVALDAVVFHPPKNENMTTPTYPETLPEPGEPGRDDPLGDYDVIIVGDVAPADVPAGIWARLESYVGDRGGTLVLGVGPRHWSAMSESETARRLLPVLDPRPVEAPIDAVDPAHPALPPGTPIAPTPAAAADPDAWPMLQLDPESDPASSPEFWSRLPRLPWLLAGRAKPGATALAVARDAGDDTGRAAIAAQPYGLGKVLWVGTGDTWRWRFRAGDRHHHRFWGRVVRWATSDRLVAGNALVRFGPTRPRVAAGDVARLQARIGRRAAGNVDPTNLLVAARVFRADPETGRAAGEAVALVPLRAMPGRPRAFEGPAPPLPPGRYAVRLELPDLAGATHPGGDGDVGRGKDVPEAAFEVVARETSERVELAAAREPLDRLAAATGGRVLADFEADRLPSLLRDSLRARDRIVTRTVETPLWDRPAALLLFFAILTAEWIGRKRLGLP